jgi:argininosuccinate synthase
MTRIVLAFGGSLEACAAIPWLAGTFAAEVVTVTLDVGQDQPVEQLRARALACGAIRAHVIDSRDDFARECVVPSIHAASRSGQPHVAALARPLVARKLIEIAAIEGASAIAHASADEAFHLAVAALNPSLRVLAPVREWGMNAAQLVEYVRQRGLPFVPSAELQHVERNLLVRPATDPARAPDREARVELTFRDHVPVALNGVPMAAAELIESLSLIAGQHGVGWRESFDAPAALVLHAAYGALREPAGMVTLKVSRGEVICA